jgi:PAS domain S-box-containing protein
VSLENPLLHLARCAWSACARVIDPTSRHCAHGAHTERHFKALSEAVDRLVVCLDADGCILEVNPCACRTAQRAATELLGRDWAAAMVAPAHQARARAQFDAAMGGACLAGSPCALQAPDGHAALVRWTLTVVSDVEGAPCGALAIGEDLTSQVEAEALAASQRDQLARLGRIASLSQLGAALAHELSQPLTAIRSNAQAAQRSIAHHGAANIDINGILEDIVSDTELAGEVVQRVRAMVRNEPRRHVRMDVAGVVRNASRLLQREAQLRGVRLYTDLGECAVAVICDKVQLQQVFVNLLMNAFDAVKHLPGGQREVALHLRRMPHRRVRITVSDCGSGLSEDAAAHLFKPFFSTKPDGMGLGLPISRAIVDAHHGSLLAENNAQSGASFHVTLPSVGEELLQDGTQGKEVA